MTSPDTHLDILIWEGGSPELLSEGDAGQCSFTLAKVAQHQLASVLLNLQMKEVVQLCFCMVKFSLVLPPRESTDLSLFI